jgi:ribonuclease D
MTYNPDLQPKMIATAKELERLATLLAGETVIACDLEADSLHHYREKVCLIQIATAREVFLVDPLALADINPLGPVLANPAIRKVFHGADYDMRSLYRDFSLEVNNLFDTMVACQFLGEKELGLAAVLKKRFGVELDKKYQKADWSKRPLDAGMIAYAAADTSLLVALYEQLSSELAGRGRLSWVEEECRLLSQVRAADREGEPFFSRFKGASRLDRRTLAVLEALLRFRDDRARQVDRPPFKVLGNDTLRELAEKKPETLADMAGLSGLPPRSLERYGKDILKAVAAGCALPESQLPQMARPARPEKDPVREERISRLKRWRERKAEALGIDGGILANNALLETLAQEMPRDRNGLDALAALRGWQKDELGEEMLLVLQ